MDKTVIFIIALGLLVSNPDKQDFVDFMKTELSKKLDKNNSTNVNLNRITQGIAGFLLNEFVDRKNYYLFSIYKINRPPFFGASKDDSTDKEFFGIAGTFLPLSKEATEVISGINDSNINEPPKTENSSVRQTLAHTASSEIKDLTDITAPNKKLKTASDKLSSLWFEQEFQIGDDKLRVFFIKSQSIDESGEFNNTCYACGVQIAAVTYKQVNNEWELISKQERVGENGEYGDVQSISQAEVIKLTPDNILFLIGEKYDYQGESGSGKSLYLFTKNKWIDAGHINTNRRTNSSSGCPNEFRQCYSYEGKISVIPSTKEYPDLLVTRIGTILDENGNVIPTKNITYEFKDGEYKEATIEL
jgi:hypothetical protein